MENYYNKGAVSTQILEYNSKTYLERCQEIIRNEKALFFKDYQFKLTDKMIADSVGVSVSTLKNLVKFSEPAIKKYRLLLKKVDIPKQIYKKMLKKKI